MKIALLGVLISFLYYQILGRLVVDWWTDPNFSHGFLVPAFSALVAWQNRKRLAAQEIKPSWIGLWLIAGSLLILIAGVLGAELFLSRSSLVFLLAGLIIYFLGWGHFRILLFPSSSWPPSSPVPSWHLLASLCSEMGTLFNCRA